MAPSGADGRNHEGRAVSRRWGSGLRLELQAAADDGVRLGGSSRDEVLERGELEFEFLRILTAHQMKEKVAPTT